MSTITVSTVLTEITCPECAGVYAISKAYQDEALRVGKFKLTWTCPYCKTSRGYGDGEMQLKEREIARLQTSIEHNEAVLQRTRANLEHAEASNRAFKGVITKTKKRIGKGVCPCCNRSFSDLAAHMSTKHPKYADPEDK